MYILIVFLFSPPSLLISIRLSSTWTHSHFTSTNRLSLDAGDHSRHRSAPTCTISHRGGLYRRSRDRVTGQHSTRIIPIDRWKRSAPLLLYKKKIIIIIIIITSKQNTQTKKKIKKTTTPPPLERNLDIRTTHIYIYISLDITASAKSTPQHHKIHRCSTMNTTFTTTHHYNHYSSTLLLLPLLLLLLLPLYYHNNDKKKNCITSRKKP